MSKPTPIDPVIVGDFLIKAALADTDEGRRNRDQLIDDPRTALDGLVTIPDDHEVVFHFNSKNVSNFMVPWQGFLRPTLASVAAGGYRFPGQYDSGQPALYINPQSTDANERIRAYNFRVGDYTFGQCG